MPGESLTALLKRQEAALKNAPAPERNLSTNAPLLASGDEGSRDQGIKGLVSSKPDQGVFDSTNNSPEKPDSSQDALFIDKYGDIMGVVNGHPLCLKAVNQWEVYPQALTNAMKQHGISKVIDALRYTANYKAAKSPAKFFWHQVRK